MRKLPMIMLGWLMAAIANDDDVIGRLGDYVEGGSMIDG